MLVRNKYTDEKNFRQTCSKYNTPEIDYAWHGSGAENWLSILSRGLIIGGTDGVPIANGAAAGRGIYLAKDFRYSHGYSGGNAQIRYMGLFKIVKEKDTHEDSIMYVR